jgi:tetratricopeptide (TPR) repeat protein
VLAAVPLDSRASGSVEKTVLAARQAAREDRNAEAARLFQDAVTEAPELRLDLLPELADQLTYSGRAGEAIPLYQEVLASHTLSPAAARHTALGLALAESWDHKLPQALATYAALLLRDPSDIDALLGHARVLSWENRLKESLREYQEVLRVEPGNLEALENIARVQSWRGRQRSAQRRARAILAQHPENRPAALTLANSELWMGRPDVAASESRSYLPARPSDPNVRDLYDDINDARSPQFNLASSTANSSDRLNIRSTTMEAVTHEAQGAASLGFRYQPISYEGAGSTGSASERRVGVFGSYRFNDWSEVHAAVLNDDITATGTTEKSRLLYDGYVTLWPNDTFRFDVGTRQETFDNIVSLQMGITVATNSISMDFTPDEDTRLTVRASSAQLSDGNRRGWNQLEFERSFARAPHVLFGVRTTGYSFSEALNDGYFSPLRYRSAELTFHLYGDARRRLYYDVAGGYGREWVLFGGTRPTHELHAALSYLLSRKITVQIFYDSFDTRQIDSGFARTTLGLGLQTRW